MPVPVIMAEEVLAAASADSEGVYLAAAAPLEDGKIKSKRRKRI